MHHHIPGIRIMASSFISSQPLTTTPFLVKPTHFPNIRKPSLTYKISCKSTNNDQESSSLQPSVKLDRRNVMIGLGAGLYGATSPFAFASPISPDFSQCGPSHKPNGDTIHCCPPQTTPHIIDYKFPPPPSKPRLRPAAHLVDEAYQQKYKEAVRRMRALPDNDPRSFNQQAKVHCAYCDGAYHEVGFPHIELQIHQSWLFFPFHRCYLYFFERILGKLIDDPTFALPFWNWDAHGGMTIPDMYTKTDSPLYDQLREGSHQPPTVIDLNYGNKGDYNLVDLNKSSSDQQQIQKNLLIMYKQMVWSKTPRLFFGKPYRAGDAPDPGMGSIELVPHNTVHDWTGDSKQPNHEDMGVLYSAARDPIFFAHHSNVDRMWSLWKTLPGGRREDITDPDYLHSSFVFYDENKQLVRVKVRDCLDNRCQLGYDYQTVEIPWLNSRPQPRVFPVPRERGTARLADQVFPAKLDRTLKAMVKRPKIRRSKKEKDEKEEILVINGIEFERDVYTKFDIYINDVDDNMTTEKNTEFAGSFVTLPHKHKDGKKKMKTQLVLSITEILEDLDAEGDDYVLVKLVPRTAVASMITIDQVKIDYD